MTTHRSRLFSSILRLKALFLLIALVGGSATGANAKDKAREKCLLDCHIQYRACENKFVHNKVNSAITYTPRRLCDQQVDTCHRGCSQA